MDSESIPEVPAAAWQVVKRETVGERRGQRASAAGWVHVESTETHVCGRRSDSVERKYSGGAGGGSEVGERSGSESERRRRESTPSRCNKRGSPAAAGDGGLAALQQTPRLVTLHVVLRMILPLTMLPLH